ncbi:MAG: COX15/CtaA family protein [Akkermansiaceae bacterium]|nr:COX15/CtaA family protein [Akkermansiaceae bacterium]
MKPDASPAFHRYALVLAGMTVILIWWGAAVTTTQAGMAFSDWPLSFGSINPPGWLKILPYFLEHSHRLIAATVGLLTLGAFVWQIARTPRAILEIVALVILLALVTGFAGVAGAERTEPARKALFFKATLVSGLVPVGWLAWSWWRRGWPLLTRLTALALIVVTAQAILGGLRVTEVSDRFGIVHGCVGQFFFCVVLFLARASSPGWEKPDSLDPAVAGPARRLSAMLAAAVFVQLILGATMRHLHRAGLPDTGLFRTRGQWIPGFEPVEVGMIFLHKTWALVVFGLGIGLAAWLWTRREVAVGPLRHALAIAGLLTLQIALGVGVILTGSPEHKKFWVTNFHVINGLAILGLAFLLAVRCRRATRRRTLLAEESAAGPGG